MIAAPQVLTKYVEEKRLRLVDLFFAVGERGSAFSIMQEAYYPKDFFLYLRLITLWFL